MSPSPGSQKSKLNQGRVLLASSSFGGSLTSLGLWPHHCSPCLCLPLASLCSFPPSSLCVCVWDWPGVPQDVPRLGSSHRGTLPPTRLLPADAGPGPLAGCARRASPLGSSFPATVSSGEGVAGCSGHTQVVGAVSRLPGGRRSCSLLGILQGLLSLLPQVFTYSSVGISWDT